MAMGICRIMSDGIVRNLRQTGAVNGMKKIRKVKKSESRWFLLGFTVVYSSTTLTPSKKALPEHVVKRDQEIDEQVRSYLRAT